MLGEDSSPLADLIQPAIRQSPDYPSQADLAKALSVSESLLSEYLQGKRSIPIELVAKIAERLKVDLDVALIAAFATWCRRETKVVTNDIEIRRTAYRRILGLLESLKEERRPPQRLEHISLESFPNLGSKGRWRVLLADRRESPPQGLGDILALSGSSADVMFLPNLNLGPGTRVLSDKVFKVAQESDLKRLLDGNILAIGSPAVCLATRAILASTGSTFLFNIGQGHYDAEKNLYREIPELEWHNQEALKNFCQRDDVRQRVDALLATFRKNGFVDPVHFAGIRGRAIPRSKDYGIIAIAQNPWSPENLVCICAGVHAPGTAGAVQLLSKSVEFKMHPWGGVLTVQLSDQARWEDRFGHLNPKWETHDYSTQEYLNQLDRMIEGVNAKHPAYKDVEISSATLVTVREFAQQRLVTPKIP